MEMLQGGADRNHDGKIDEQDVVRSMVHGILLAVLTAIAAKLALEITNRILGEPN